VDLRSVTRGTIEALVKCGAFTSITPRRAPLLQVLDRAVEMGQQSQNDKRSGQLNMFGAATAGAASSTFSAPLPDIEELPNAELLKFEKELLGFYITSHPLTEHQATLDRYTTTSTREAMNCSEGTEITIGGMISRIKKTITKNGRSAGMAMAMITLEDLEGQIDGVLFAETFAEVNEKYPGAVAAESIVFVKGKLDKRRETPSIIVSEVIPVEASIDRLTTGILLRLDRIRHQPQVVAQLKPILGQYRGRLPIFVQVAMPDQQKVILKVNGDMAVKPSMNLIGDLEQLLGSGSVELTGAGTKRVKRLQQQQLFRDAEASAQDEETLLVAAADAAMDDPDDVREEGD
jgi:DNA polymerase-3 subunit alpha